MWGLGIPSLPLNRNYHKNSKYINTLEKLCNYFVSV